MHPRKLKDCVVKEVIINSQNSGPYAQTRRCLPAAAGAVGRRRNEQQTQKSPRAAEVKSSFSATFRDSSYDMSLLLRPLSGRVANLFSFVVTLTVFRCCGASEGSVNKTSVAKSCVARPRSERRAGGVPRSAPTSAQIGLAVWPTFAIYSC